MIGRWDPGTQYLLDPNRPFDQMKMATLQQHITNIYSNDISKVTDSNAVLSQLKLQDTFIMSIQYVLENAKLQRTKFYMLLAMQQRLPFMWESLPFAQRENIRRYFAMLFLQLCQVKQTVENRSIFGTVSLAMVKMFILAPQEWPSFTDDLIGQGKKDQAICDAVISVMGILADELTQLRNNNQKPNVLSFMSTKYESIMILCLMVIEASRTNKLRTHLLKSSLQTLEKYILLLPQNSFLPQQSTTSLLELLKTNVFRDIVIKILTNMCSVNNSTELQTQIIDCIKSFLEPNVSLVEERTKVAQFSSKDIEPFDKLMRNLAALFLQIIKVSQNIRILQPSYQYLLELSQLDDNDTWSSCQAAWLHYFRNQMQLQLRLQRLLPPLVRNAPAPLDLSEKQDQQEVSEYQTILLSMATKNLQIVQKTIWDSIQQQIYVKFKKKRFESCCYCLCLLSNCYSVANKDKIIDIIKLLLNLSESISPEYRRYVVNQILNIASFYPMILTGNPFLCQVVQQKFLENIPHSLKAMIYLANFYSFSPQFLKALEDKVYTIQHETNGYESTIKNIWAVILISQKATSDQREIALTTESEQILSYVLRNYAGLEYSKGLFSVNWSALETVFVKNIDIMKNLLDIEGQHALKIAKNSGYLKAHTSIIKLCCLQYRLMKPNSQQFMQLIRSIISNSSPQQLSQLMKYVS